MILDKHYIKFKGGDWREVQPELYDLQYKWKKDDNIKSWVLQMTSAIKLKGVDYDFVKKYEEASNECKTLDYKIERDSIIEFEGYLNLRGEYYITGKLFIGKIIDIERLECLMKGAEINLFDYADERVTIRPYLGNLELAEYTKSYEDGGWGNVEVSGSIKYASAQWVLVYDEDSQKTEKADINAGGAEYITTNYIIKKWIREVYYSATEPSGGGWFEVETGKWARKVSVTQNETKRSNNIGFEDYYIIKSWSYLPDTQIKNGIRLSEVLTNVIKECGEFEGGNYEFQSQFFKDTVTKSNKVYDNATDLYHNIILYQITDITQTGNGEGATKMMVKKGDFIQELLSYFNLEMWLDTDIYIEHKSFKTRELKINIKESEYYKDNYKYKEGLVKIEMWQHAQGSNNKNFKDIIIEYDKNCVREINRAEPDESYEILFTDLTSALSNKALWDKEDLSKDAVAMISTKDGVITRSNTLYESTVINGCLSFAYLILNIYNYDRAQQLGRVGDRKIYNEITGTGKEGSIKYPIKPEKFLEYTPYNLVDTDNGAATVTAFEYKNRYCKINYELL